MAEQAHKERKELAREKEKERKRIAVERRKLTGFASITEGEHESFQGRPLIVIPRTW